MPKSVSLPYSCTRCETIDISKLSHYEPTDVWSYIWPNDQLIHLHFGLATNSDKESTAETQWVYDNLMKVIETEYPETSFFTISDVSRADDSESPSDGTKKLYKKMLKHPQNAQLVFFGASHSMTFLINMIKHLVREQDRIKVVKTLKDAEAMYDEWLATQK